MNGARAPRAGGSGGAPPAGSGGRRGGLVMAAVVLLGVVLAVAAALVWGASLIPFRVFQARVDAMAGDGHADNFTPALFSSLVFKFRLFASLLLVAAAALLAGRRKAARWIERRLDELHRFWADAAGAARAAARADGPVHRALLLTVLAVGTGLRLRYLLQPMRYDESATFLEYASRPFYFALSNYSAPNNHLFHTALVRVAYLTFGNEPWAIRIPALVAGVLLIPAAYLAGRMLYNRDAGLLAAGLVASSSILVEYSTNARGYSMLALVFLVLLALGAYLARGGEPGGWQLFAVAGALGFYTIPVMLYPFGIICLWLLWSTLAGDFAGGKASGLRRLFTTVAATALLVLILYAPVFTVSGVQAVTGNQYVVSRAWSYFAAGLWTSARALWLQWNRDVPTLLAVALALGAVFATLFHRKLSGYRIPPMLAALAWPVPVLLLQRVVPFERVWLFFLPLYLVTASAGIQSCLSWAAGRLGGARFRTAATAAAALGAAVWISGRVLGSESVLRSTETGTLRDAEEIALILKGRLRDGDRVVAAVPSSYSLAYYFVKHDVPVSHLLARAEASCRFVVVVDTANQQTFGTVLDSAKIAPGSMGSPVAAGRFRTATLYQAASAAPACRGGGDAGPVNRPISQAARTPAAAPSRRAAAIHP